MLRVQLKFDSAFNLLQTLSHRLDNPEELLAPAVPVVARAIERNFDQEGRPQRWPPLAPAYAHWKARFYPGRKILELSGRLRRSIQTRVEGRALVVSTDVPYAPYHQFGLSRAKSRGAPGRNLPARPFLVLTESDRQEVAETIARALSEN